MISSRTSTFTVIFHCIVLGLLSPGNWGSSKFFRSVGSVPFLLITFMDLMPWSRSWTHMQLLVLGFWVLGFGHPFLSPF